jgi:hypothetical protein
LGGEARLEVTSNWEASDFDGFESRLGLPQTRSSVTGAIQNFE